MNDPIGAHLDAGPMGFHIVHEMLPRKRLDRPRELVFTAQPSVEALPGGARVYYYAPEAESVVLALMDEPARRPMTPSDKRGYWVCDVTGLIGGLYFYDVYVNGVQALDTRGNVTFSSRALNCFEVAEAGYDDYYMKNVPHGAVQTRYFYSAQSRSMRCALVYTPAGYDEGDARYPVLYLQHGGGENEGGWLWNGRANFILDNLIAQGRCAPMLAVMNDCCVLTEEDGKQAVGSCARMVGGDCVPFIDSAFRTLPDRRFRAAAGLSQGGLNTREIVFENPGLFSQLGVFSSGAGFEPDSADIWGRRHDYRAFFTSSEAYARMFPVTLITCGADDPRNAYLKPQAEALRSQGYPVEYRCYPGAHVWQVWRKSLSAFLPMLFEHQTK